MAQGGEFLLACGFRLFSDSYLILYRKVGQVVLSNVWKFCGGKVSVLAAGVRGCFSFLKLVQGD